MDLPAFIETVPDYEVRKGRMHVAIGAFELVMPLDVYLRACAKADAAIAKWCAKQNPGCGPKVVRLRRHD